MSSDLFRCGVMERMRIHKVFGEFCLTREFPLLLSCSGGVSNLRGRYDDFAFLLDYLLHGCSVFKICVLIIGTQCCSNNSVMRI